jgi:outer membrane protein OmpA-like peptidoglycan-associated protein
MRPTSSLIPLLLVLGSCGSPPKPPTVDESNKRPANSAMAVDLQVCKSDLQNTRILATESSRLADSAAATLARVSAQQQAIAAVQMAAPSASPANSVFTIRFGFGSTRVVVPADAASALVESARGAPLVLLRGRTDGATDSAAESRIARERAAAVRDYLVGAGVDAARIRATYQPAGDHAADNSSPAGQGLNRRVEIEVYRALPVAMGSSAAAMP